ncbi:MAG: hypothetical protein GY830_00650 [Bacteroidetes bacterium]|nr:hypothetical protein [Bacteroidota bacterium]
MIKHRGEFVHKAIKQKKYSIEFISKKLGITRNTFYKKLKNSNLSLDMIVKVSNIIEYDFISEIPEIKEYARNNNLFLYKNTKEKNIIIYKLKYLKLMYQYNALLDFMINLADNHDLQTLKEDIKEFVKSRDV